MGVNLECFLWNLILADAQPFSIINSKYLSNRKENFSVYINIFFIIMRINQYLI